jgi:rubrerythrin
MEAHRTPDAARFFRTMADNELKHAQMLADRRRLTCGDDPVTVDRSLVVEAEAPEYDGARAFMSIREALDVAYAAEVKAYEFYDRALPQAADDKIRELFTDLRDQEVQHQSMIKAIMEKVPEDGPFDPDDFVDPPTAQ